MPRPEKVQAVEEIKERFENAEATFLTEYRGLTVSEQQQLRRGLREANAEYKVVKMSLARLAATELGLDELTESMIGPTAIAFANTDPVPVAKVLKDFAKDHEHLVLKVAVMSGKLLPPEQVSKLAEIEPRDVLLGKIAGAAKAPLAKMAGMLGSFMRDTASMMSQLLEKKESGEFVSADEAASAVAEADEVAAEPEAAEEAAADKEPEEAAAVETTEAEEQPAVEAEEEAAPEADEPVVEDDSDPEDAAAEGDEPAAETDDAPEAEAEIADAEDGSEEEAESDDSSDSDSESDDAADKAEKE